MLSSFPQTWQGLFECGCSADSLERILAKVSKDRAASDAEIYPPETEVFSALREITPAKVRVVIVGQDPYPTPGRAHGLAFSVLPGNPIPGSLRNIFAELERSIPGWRKPKHGCLRPWVGQGVLLLNRTLTVKAGTTDHLKIGWQEFTSAIVRYVQQVSPFLVFMLWGRHAADIAAEVDQSKHAVLLASHPSPLAQNTLPTHCRFVGSGQFIKANELLISRGFPPVDWTLPAQLP